jgi:hypothetical protein
MRVAGEETALREEIARLTQELRQSYMVDGIDGGSVT